MKLTPCQSPGNDPDDWFIERDGKQYKDEPILTKDEIHSAIFGVSVDDWLDAVEAAEREKIKANLIKRRKAKEACHFECPVRLECLDVRLSQFSGTAGTWGGYYPEELAQIESERNRRANRRRT